MRFPPFPDDLVTAQRSWTAAYEELARPHAASPTVLRRRLLRLSTQMYFHPYWAHPRPAAGWAELRDLVREQCARKARAA
ncbi:hypothetical protein ACFV14_27010 [Streptomyces zaomyceticus]|uniref:hypothetical protein n=1 Tax=Streptomyces zaomyceticus TaxID=68286 RepID=UPI00368275B7